MGLHLCYELALPADVREAEAAGLVARLHAYARTLPVADVSRVIRLAGRPLADRPRLRGLCYNALEDVAHLSATWAREELYRRAIGIDDEDTTAYWNVRVPPDVPAVALGFAVAPGAGSEPASFGVARLTAPAEHRALGWWWHRCTKTQYASLHGDAHLLRVHGSLVDVLVEAERIGFATTIRDEFGYWPERDPAILFAAAREMNAVVAKIAGAFTDAVRDAGGDSRAVDGAIFAHPDFERLETE